MHKRADIGNKFMKSNVNVNLNKTRTSSDERDSSKTPTQQIYPGHPLPIIPASEKIDGGYYSGYIKQLNDKNHIKIHHPVLKKTNLKYEHKKTNKTRNSGETIGSSMPSITTDKSKNTSENTHLSNIDSFNLPIIHKANSTQNIHQNNSLLSGGDTSRNFFEGVERNDNVSLLKLQFSDRVPNSRQTNKSFIPINATATNTNTNKNHIESNKNTTIDNRNNNLYDNSDSYVNILEHPHSKNDNESHQLGSKSLQVINYNQQEDTKIGTRQTARSSHGSVALPRYYSDSNVYTPITRSGNLNNNNYFINVFESFQI